MKDIANVKVHLSKDSQRKCKYFNTLPYLFKQRYSMVLTLIRQNGTYTYVGVTKIDPFMKV